MTKAIAELQQENDRLQLEIAKLKAALVEVMDEVISLQTQIGLANCHAVELINEMKGTSRK